MQIDTKGFTLQESEWVQEENCPGGGQEKGEKCEIQILNRSLLWYLTVSLLLA
jgi:hypothetical protein